MLSPPPSSPPGPSVVGTPMGANVWDGVRVPSSPENSVKEDNVKPSKGILFSVFMSVDPSLSHVCGVKRGVGPSMCIDVDCTVVAHQGKYCHILPNHAYVKKNDSTAFLEPSADISNLAPDIKTLWETETASIPEW